MDRNLLLVGGGILAAGGLAYWYLSQQQNGNGPSGCEQYDNQTDCEVNGCYWYFNSCHNIPYGVEPCQYLGDCYSNITSWQLCDAYDNLCRCDGNTWSLVQKDSYICRDDIKYDKCGVNKENKVFCNEYYGHGTKECKYYAAGCSCSIGECQDSCYCNPDDKICIRKATGGTVIGDDSIWSCYEDHITSHGGNSCLIPLDEPYVATQFLGGTFSWKWGFIGVSYMLEVYLCYKGTCDLIWYKPWEWMWGSEGTETIDPFVFSDAKVYDSIILHAESNQASTNIKPSSFVGKFLF